MPQEVKPCPLCGNAVCFHAPEWETRMDGAIECFKCDLTLTVPHSCNSTEQDETSWDQAVALWNTRNCLGD